MADIARRNLLVLAAGVSLMAAEKDQRAWDFRFPSIDGADIDLADFKGRVLLVVNTASFCGYTYQYEGLERLYKTQSPLGLTVIGVPSQDFNQESKDNATVKAFCETRFDIDFPLTAIQHVRGPQAAPFYTWVQAQRGWQPQWNFNKVLVGRDGRIVQVFSSGDEPDGPELSRSLGFELARSV